MEFDAATRKIEEFARRVVQLPVPGGSGPQPAKVVLKKKRVVEPAKLVVSAYLETQADVDGFLDKLRMELEQAIASDERVEIR